MGTIIILCLLFTSYNLVPPKQTQRREITLDFSLNQSLKMQEISLSKSTRTAVLLSLQIPMSPHRFPQVSIQHSPQAQRTECAGLFAGPQSNSILSDQSFATQKTPVGRSEIPRAQRELTYTININIGICTSSEVVFVSFCTKFQGDT